MPEGVGLYILSNFGMQQTIYCRIIARFVKLKLFYSGRAKGTKFSIFGSSLEEGNCCETKDAQVALDKEHGPEQSGRHDPPTWVQGQVLPTGKNVDRSQADRRATQRRNSQFRALVDPRAVANLEYRCVQNGA